MEVNEIVKLSAEKTAKICSSLKEGTTYDGMNDDIEFIFQCAFDKRKTVWDYCVVDMWELAKISSEVRERIITIMEKGKAQEKFIITCSSRRLENAGNEFFKKIVYLAITDKSKKVKIFGAQKADSYSLYEFAELIKEESEKAADNDVKEELLLHYIYLTKGYRIEKGDAMLYIGRIEKDVSSVVFHGGRRSIPREIEEKDFHKYVITKHKDIQRIEDLYYSGEKNVTT